VNVADLAIAFIIVVSVGIGVVRGFVVEVMALAVWVTAVALSMMFGGRVAELFAESVTLPSARVAIGHALVFIAVLVVGAIATYILRKLVESTGLSGTDRLLGLVFGFARGALLVVVLVLLLGWTPMPRDAWWQESQAIPAFQRAAEHLSHLLPEKVRRYIDFSPETVVPKVPVELQSPPPTAAGT
jgi:membrane protein required for colicin V production